MEDNIKQQILEFEKMCDNMSASNYVMIDKSISSVLKSVVKNKDVFNVVAEQVISFNFAKFFDIATRSVGMFIMPEDIGEKTAFCFCLLNEIDNKNVNVTNLISDHFAKNMIEGYSLFCQMVVDEFCLCVKTLCEEKFSADKNLDNAKAPRAKNKPYEKKVVDSMLYILEGVQSKINEEKRVVFELKNMALVVCESLHECLIDGNEKPVIGLFFGLKSLCSSMKKVKNDILELEMLVLNK